MKILDLFARSRPSAAGGQRTARVVGAQLATLLLAVVVNPPAAALGDTHAEPARPAAGSAAPERHD